MQTYLPDTEESLIGLSFELILNVEEPALGITALQLEVIVIEFCKTWTKRFNYYQTAPLNSPLSGSVLIEGYYVSLWFVGFVIFLLLVIVE